MEASMFISVASAQRGVSKLTSYFSWVFTFNFEVLLSNRYWRTVSSSNSSE